MDLAIDPKNTSIVYAGSYYIGVYKTTDGGGHWTATNTGLTDPHVIALAVDPQHTNSLYAGTSASGVFVINFSDLTYKVYLPLILR